MPWNFLPSSFISIFKDQAICVFASTPVATQNKLKFLLIAVDR